MIFNHKRPCVSPKQISKLIALIGALFILFFPPALNAADKLDDDLVIKTIKMIGKGLIENSPFVNKDLQPYMQKRIVEEDKAINIYLFPSASFATSCIENKQLMDQVVDTVVRGLIELKTAVAKNKMDITMWGGSVDTDVGSVYILLIFSSAFFSPENLDVISQAVSLIKDGLVDKDALIAEDGTSLLMLASLIGNDKIVSDLLEMGANPNKVRESDGTPPLVAAVLNGYDKVVRVLLENGADANYVGEDGCTVLISVIQKGDIEIAKILLENKANPNLTNKDGLTALMLACDMGYIEMVKMLLEKGAEVNKENGDKRTVLMQASLKKHPEIVKMLLEKGAAINLADKNGQTALMLASSIDFIELHLAKININLVYPHVKKRTEIVKTLLEKGATADLADENGWTALMFASVGGYIEIVNMLLEKGVDVNKTNSEGRTSLMLASLNNRPEVVKALLEKGAAMDIVDKDGWTALMFASSNGGVEIMENLISNGANASIENKNGMTASMLASKQINAEVEKNLGEEKERLINPDSKNNPEAEKILEEEKESSTSSDNKKNSRVYVISYAPESESQWIERYNSFSQKESFFGSMKKSFFCFYYTITLDSKKQQACWTPPAG